MKILNFLKKKKSTIIQLVSSLALLALAGCVGIGLGLYKTNGTKKYIMEAYDYYKENNWKALYNYAELTDDDFVNEYFFEELAKKKYGNVNKDTLKMGETKKEENKALVTLYYKDSSGNKVNCDFTMIKKPTKRYKFFNEWKLDISNLIIKECKVVVPSGFDVYVDGVCLTKDNTKMNSNSQTGMVEYVIPQMFMGDHEIFAKKDMLQACETIVTWNKDKGEYIVDTSTLKLVEGVETYINSASESIVQLMYKNIFEETQLTGLEEYMLNSEETKAVFTSTYEKLLAAIQPEDGSTLNSLNITGFENYKIEYSHPNKALVSIDFTCTFKARGPRDAASGARDKYEGEARSTITMEYTYDGNDWMCSTLNMDCIDYSKKEEVEETE